MIGESIIAGAPVVAYDIPNYRPSSAISSVTCLPSISRRSKGRQKTKSEKCAAARTISTAWDLTEFKRANSWETTQAKFLSALERLRAAQVECSRERGRLLSQRARAHYDGGCMILSDNLGRAAALPYQ